MTRITHLNASLARLTDSALNLLSEVSNLTIESNIFNSTTWGSLSNETLSMLHEVGQFWLHRYTMDGHIMRGFVLQELFDTLIRMFPLLDNTLYLLEGGDVWQKLRIIYENTDMELVLTLIEDIPNIVVSVVDTFVKSDRLNDFVEKLAVGKAHPCDIDKYLIVPSFVRKKVLLPSIFCQKSVFIDGKSLLPLDAKYKVGKSKVRSISCLRVRNGGGKIQHRR